MKEFNKILSIRLIANIMVCIISAIMTVKLSNIDNDALFFLSIAILTTLSLTSVNIIDRLSYKRAGKECGVSVKYCDDWIVRARIELEAREDGIL